MQPPITVHGSSHVSDMCSAPRRRASCAMSLLMLGYAVPAKNTEIPERALCLTNPFPETAATPNAIPRTGQAPSTLPSSQSCHLGSGRDAGLYLQRRAAGRSALRSAQGEKWLNVTFSKPLQEERSWDSPGQRRRPSLLLVAVWSSSGIQNGQSSTH